MHGAQEQNKAETGSSSFNFQNTAVVVLTPAFLAIDLTQGRAEGHSFTLNIGIKQVVGHMWVTEQVYYKRKRQ